MGPLAPLSFGAFGPKTYSYLSLEKEESEKAVCINGDFGPIKFWGKVSGPSTPKLIRTCHWKRKKVG